MRRWHPPEIALVVIAIASIVSQWLLNEWARTNPGFDWTTEPSEEQVIVMALNQLSWLLSPALAFATAGSVLGLVFVWCFAPPDQAGSATRTMSAAGSTENLAERTEPNSSPSI